MDDVGEEGVEEELSCGQSFDEAHGRSAARTRPRGASRWGHTRCVPRWWGDREQLATASQPAGPRARSEEAEVADADEARRQYVEEKASKKLVDVKRERAYLTAVTIVLPSKRDGGGGDVDEPVVGDGHPVGVAGEVVQHVGRAAKGWLRIDDPGLAVEGSEKRTEGLFGRQRSELARKGKAALATRLAETGDELAPIDLPQHGNWEEEVGPGVDPPGPVRGHAAHRHDAVDVGMMLESLPPRVQDHQPAHVGAQALRVRGDLAYGLSGGLQQEVIHHTLIDEREARERFRHREDEVDVPDGQELLFARRHPRIARRGQTLRAMPVAAAVIREDRVCALLTAITMPTQCRRAALGDDSEHASMLPGHPGLVRLQKTIAVLAHDVGHLKGWPRHRLCSRRDL